MGRPPLLTRNDHRPAISPVFLDASRSIKVPQDCLDWPDKALLNTVGVAINNSDKVLGQSHTDISTNAREDVPPPMQLE